MRALRSTTTHLATIATLAVCACAQGTPKDGAGVADAAVIDDIDADTTPRADARPIPDAPPGPTIDASGPGTCSPCELVSQCGCSAPDVCDLDPANFASGATACRAVSSPGGYTATCDDQTDCAGGFTCIGLDQAACKKYCESDADCTAPGGLCIVTLTSGGTPIPNATICTTNCTPTNSAGCPSGFGCHTYHHTDSGRNLTDCDPPGPGELYDTCATNDDCQANATCVDTGLETVCLRNCIVGVSAECGFLEDCLGFDPPAVIGGTEYGICY